jgi:hypothetical protein
MPFTGNRHSFDSSMLKVQTVTHTRNSQSKIRKVGYGSLLLATLLTAVALALAGMTTRLR